MNAIDTLIRAGYIVALVHRDGLDMVEAKRTDKATISAKTAGGLIKEVLRNQDEAVRYMREQLRSQWFREACGLDGASGFDQAIAVYELMLNAGREIGSDGEAIRKHIERLQGLVIKAGAVEKLSAAARGQISFQRK